MQTSKRIDIILKEYELDWQRVINLTHETHTLLFIAAGTGAVNALSKMTECNAQTQCFDWLTAISLLSSLLAISICCNIMWSQNMTCMDLCKIKTLKDENAILEHLCESVDSVQQEISNRKYRYNLAIIFTIIGIALLVLQKTMLLARVI